ncbi:hypothetical protein C2S51_007435 [Perilla frutescens var. frutescens]|nr:hypothetical protein C2S51_007435 [Perilla frutescens var. frutescens]
MEFLHTQSRYNGSSLSQNSSSKRKKVGLLVFDEKPFKEAHIVFSTRNLTKSITKITKIPSNTTPSKHNLAPKNHPTVGILEKAACLLSSHGLRCGNSGSVKPGRFEHTLSLLPQTVCTKHGTTSFLPLDYVKKMAEYTRTTTYRYPILKVVHSFEDCILEFPFPPPIGSSEEECLDLDYSTKCYQCFTTLSTRRTVYMYRDYVFCSHGCRLRACVTNYWYKKLMKSADHDAKNNIDDVNAASIKKEVFTIVS